MTAEKGYVGIDVSKAGLDVARLPSGEYWQFENTPRGIAKLVRRLRSLALERIVVEATGG